MISGDLLRLNRRCMIVMSRLIFLQREKNEGINVALGKYAQYAGR